MSTFGRLFNLLLLSLLICYFPHVLPKCSSAPAVAMVIGSVVPYIPQYFTIKQTQNTEGFSLYVCLTLLVANILRIMFWYGTTLSLWAAIFAWLCCVLNLLIGNTHFLPIFFLFPIFPPPPHFHTHTVNTLSLRFGKRFETALLVQSIVMIFAMFALLELCVRVRNSNLIIQGRRHYFAGK